MAGTNTPNKAKKAKKPRKQWKDMSRTEKIVTGIIFLFLILLIIGILNPQPKLAIDNVHNGKISTDDKTYKVSGKISGLTDGVDITVNDKQALRTDNNFYLSVNLEEGDNQITVKATKGNKSDTKQFVIYRIPEAELKAKQEAEKQKEADDTKAAAQKRAAEVAATKKRAAEEAAKNAPKTSFGDGTYLVGKDIQAGTYKDEASSDGCYWERMSGTSGSSDEILANDNPSGQAIVTIKPTDVAFTSRNCGVWHKV